jgi:hypothetical protein
MRRLLFLSTLLLSVFAGVAQASPIQFSAVLTGPNEAPPVASPGTGFALVTIDPVAHTMLVEANFLDLLGTTTAAHIHVINGPLDANQGDTVGPVATTTPSFPGFPLGVMAGTFVNQFDTTLAGSFNPAFVTATGSVAAAEAALFLAILEGRAYFNIHSTQFQGGEIRGFLQPVSAVPEPGTIALLGTGLALLATRQVRRRRVR